MAGKYELKKSKSGNWMFNLKAANGKVILTSERYSSRSAAEKGIDSIRKNAPKDGNFDRRKAKNGQPYFVLKAGNGEIIGKSEMYSGASAMETGIQSVKKNGRTKAIKALE